MNSTNSLEGDKSLTVPGNGMKMFALKMLDDGLPSSNLTTNTTTTTTTTDDFVMDSLVMIDQPSSPSKAANFSLNQSDEDNDNEEKDEDSRPPLMAIAWHNLRYDNYQDLINSSKNENNNNPNADMDKVLKKDDPAEKRLPTSVSNNPFLSVKNFLMFPLQNHHNRRRGSVPTPSIANGNNSNSPIGPYKGMGGTVSAPILRRLTGCFNFNTVNALLGPSRHARKTFVHCLMGSSSSWCDGRSPMNLSSPPSHPSRSGLSSDSKIYLFSDNSSSFLSYNTPTSSSNAAINTKDIKGPPPPANVAVLIPEDLNQCIFTEMTIGEILRYGFLFMNSMKYWQHRRRHIEIIIQEMMGLDLKILKRRFDQCTLSEQRLVAIAQELMSISLPMFMFLDEPFVDLDSTMASSVMQALRRLAKRNPITVIVSAQAPNAHLIPMFDKLYILAHGGVCIYSGPPRLLAQTLRQELHVYQCQHDDDDKRPPVEEMLKISCLEFHNAKVRKLADRTLVEEHRQLLSNLTRQLFNHSNSSSNVGQSVGKNTLRSLLLKPGQPGKFFHPIDLFIQIYRQFRLLYINRHWWSFPLKFFLTIAFYLFISLFLVSEQSHSSCNGVGWLRHPKNHSSQTCQQVIREQYSMDAYATYQMYSMWYLSSMAIGSTALFCTRILRVFQHEHQNRRYSMGVMAVSSTIIHLFDSIFWSLVTSLLMYFLYDKQFSISKQNAMENVFNWDIDWSRFITILLNHWLLFLYHQSYGMLLSVVLFHKYRDITQRNHGQHTVSSNYSSYNVLLIAISQVIVLLMQLLNNNILVIVEHMNARWLNVFASNLIAIRHVYDYAILLTSNAAHSSHHQASCHQSTTSARTLHRSIANIFQRYSVHHNELSTSGFNLDQYLRNVLPIFLIALIIRTIALIILWFRFRLKSCQSCTKLTRNRNRSRIGSATLVNNLNGDDQQQPQRPLMEMIPIDYGPPEAINSMRKKSKVRIIQPIFKDDEEEAFCQDKIQLAWRQLSLFATSSRTSDSKSPNNLNNLIVRNLNGQFRLGTMNAIIGGRSKHIRTLLLRVFSGQLKTRLSHQTRFYESKYITTNVCFISANAREEHLIPGLTAKQSLIYASTVKNIEDDFDGRLDHEEMALNILDELDLGHRASSFVEDCTRCEQKRLALALELTSLQMPNLVCMDEPAGGLDLITAEMLIRCMRQLTDRHSITFVASFHSTNHQVLYMFDQLYCLGQNGSCVYSGPPGRGIRRHLQEILSGIELYPLEELLKYSCMDQSKEPAIEKLIQQNDQQTLEMDKTLSSDTVVLPKGIKTNIKQFSVIGVKRLARRYRGRWQTSLWFNWIITTAIYLSIGLLLNAMFPVEVVHPDGCIKIPVFNGTNNCPQHRTGTKMIWEREAHQLWDNYRYIHLANHLFLMVVLFHSSFVFYQELKRFLTEHENGWFSSGVFYVAHNLFMDMLPMIPVIMAYMYIIDLDNSPPSSTASPSSIIIVNATQTPTSPRPDSATYTTYWWSVGLLWIATKSIQSISHMLVCLMVAMSNRSELTLWSSLTIFALLQITSNFQIRSKFPLSFLNVFRYLDEASLVLHYGFFNRCSKDQMVSLVLNRIDSMESANVHFKHCFRALLGQTLLFRTMSWFALLFRANGDRIFQHHRLWSSSKNSGTDFPLELDSVITREENTISAKMPSDQEDDDLEVKPGPSTVSSRSSSPPPPTRRSSTSSTSTSSSSSSSSSSSPENLKNNDENDQSNSTEESDAEVIEYKM